MLLRLKQKLKFSRKIFLKKWIKFEAKTENETLLDFFLNWNELAVKTEKKTLSENFLKTGMNLRLRQKMILSQNRFLESD